MDHELFNEEILDKATQAILKTRDGLLRAAVPSPLGSCEFLNDVSEGEMTQALRRHKELMKEYPRQGAGIEAYVDSSDTGYTINQSQDALPMQAQASSAEVSKKYGLNNGVLHGLKELAINGHTPGLPTIEQR